MTYPYAVPRYTDISHFRAPYKNSLMGMGGFGAVPRYTDISHFRAPYKNSMLGFGQVSFSTTSSAAGKVGPAPLATWTNSLLKLYSDQLVTKVHDGAVALGKSVRGSNFSDSAADFSTVRWTLLNSAKWRAANFMPVFVEVLTKYGKNALLELLGYLKVAVRSHCALEWTVGAGGQRLWVPCPGQWDTAAIQYLDAKLDKDVYGLIALSTAQMTFGPKTTAPSKGGIFDAIKGSIVGTTPAPTPDVSKTDKDTGLVITCPDGSKVGPGAQCPLPVTVAPAHAGFAAALPWVAAVGVAGVIVWVAVKKKKG